MLGSDNGFQLNDYFFLKSCQVSQEAPCTSFNLYLLIALFAILLYIFLASGKLSHKFASSHYFYSPKQCRCEGCRASSGRPVLTADTTSISKHLTSVWGGSWQCAWVADPEMIYTGPRHTCEGRKGLFGAEVVQGVLRWKAHQTCLSQNKHTTTAAELAKLIFWSRPKPCH